MEVTQIVNIKFILTHLDILIIKMPKITNLIRPSLRLTLLNF